MLQIPLEEGVHNKVKVSIEGVGYTFVTNWNARFGYYSMDIAVADEDIATGVVLVSGVDIANISTIPLNRVFCVNKNEPNKDFGFTGLGEDGLVVIIEDSDLEGLNG